MNRISGIKAVIFTLLTSVCLSSSEAVSAQTRGAETSEPTTSWPYVYKDFEAGDIYLSDGQKIIQTMNVHLGHSKLHYLDKDIVRELILNDVVAVAIGTDRYIPHNGEIYKVISVCDKGMLLEQTKGDFMTLSETGGAYGSSSASSATMNLSSVDAAAVLGMNHMVLLQNKHEGKILPVITKYYIHTSQFTIQATRKELDRQFADRREEWKVWQKSHRIRWNNPEGLARIMDFL